MKNERFGMESSHAISASTSVERAPEIEKATELHAQVTARAKRTSHRMLAISISTVSLGVLGYLSLYLIESNYCATEGGILTWVLYLVIKAIIMFAAYNFFLNSMMVICSMAKSEQPENMFFNSLLSMLTNELGLIMSLLFGYCLPSYGEVLSRSKDAKGVDQFHWLMCIEGRSLADECFERRAIKGFIVAMAIIMLRDIIIFGLNFNVHYKYYADRIKKNSERVGVLQAMNDVINAGYMGDFDVISQRLIQVISKDGEVITHSDLLPFFGETMSEKIVEFCSSGDDKGITVEEIRGFYISTMFEQQSIVKSLGQNNESIENFRKVLDVLFIPTAFLYFIKILKISKPLSSQEQDINFLSLGNLDSNFLGALLFSTSYSFSDNIKSFLGSLNFIFFVRPYEVEDIIILNDKAYKVHEINLLTTVLLEESKYTVFPNSFLATQPITNLRLRKTWDEHFTFDFNFEQFEAKKDDFLAKLTAYVKKRSSEFRKKPYFSKITLKEENKASVSLVVGFNLDVSNLGVIQERRNKFLFILNSMLHECSLVPYKK